MTHAMRTGGHDAQPHADGAISRRTFLRHATLGIGALTVAGGASLLLPSGKSSAQTLPAAPEFTANGLIAPSTEPHLYASAAYQYNWRWCSACQGLWYAGGEDRGWCPKAAGHIVGASGNYGVLSGPDQQIAQHQSAWAWCKMCMGFVYGGALADKYCPKSEHGIPVQHVITTSGRYFAELAHESSGSQKQWAWCTKCGYLWYRGGGKSGVCAKGGVHDGSISGAYAVHFR